MTFKEIAIELSEAGKKAADIKWNKDYSIGEFIIKDQIFKIEVTNLDFEIPTKQFKFFRNDSVKIQNDMKYSFGVVPTIKKALREVLQNLKPEILVFSVSDESKARKNLYANEARKVAFEFKYHDLSSSEKLKELGFGEVLFGVFKKKEYLDEILINL
jgi:hypothetical protein